MIGDFSEIKRRSCQRAIEIDLALVGAEVTTPEAFAEEWPEADPEKLLADHGVVRRVNAWSEHPVIQKYVEQVKERRIMAKALDILEANVNSTNVTPGQAREIVDLLTKNREKKGYPKPSRDVHNAFSTVFITDLFDRVRVTVCNNPAETLLKVCEAAHVRDDDEIEAIRQVLSVRSKRRTLAGW
jgi:hypothetical protein